MEKEVFSTNDARTVVYTYVKKDLQHNIYKNWKKWIIFKCKTWNYKTSRRKHNRYFYFGLCKDLLDIKPEEVLVKPIEVLYAEGKLYSSETWMYI